MDDPESVLDFWLGELDPEDWYSGEPELDEEIRERFGDLWQAAHDGGLEHWVDGPAGTLAYLIVTDQFPRNLFRGQDKAFSTDPKARAAARRALDQGWDMAVPVPERQFMYLPFEHSEDIEDQDLSVTLFSDRLEDPESLLHARAHQSIIARFGRFPFRNAALSREMTREETEFMQQGSYLAEVERLRGKPSLRVVEE
ncbi:DUF924 family protein [Falsirhodobacter xinxiangensis]|uniref:DUF924 family protein n=1 Tax=Falsirhodobacter xinxiangensis TaxID=2530049 RepID=UPI0010AA8A21|nr:DUF924 family protein [Rhodobacter xinxiangensis]